MKHTIILEATSVGELKQGLAELLSAINGAPPFNEEDKQDVPAPIQKIPPVQEVEAPRKARVKKEELPKPVEVEKAVEAETPEEDVFGDDTPSEKGYSLQDVKNAMAAVGKKFGGFPAARPKCLAILKPFDVPNVSALKPEQFAACVAACEAAIK